MYGRVTAVTAVPLGDEISTGALLGATSITVDDVADFGEGPGWLRHKGTVYEYLSTDDDTGVITLASGLVAAAAEGDTVELWDPTANDGAGQASVDYEADLSPDDDIPGDPLQATVDHAMVPLLRASIRAGGTEAVKLRWDGDNLRAIGVHGKRAQVDQAHLTTPLLSAYRAADSNIAHASWVTLSWTVNDLGTSQTTGSPRVSRVGAGIPGASAVSTFTITEAGLYDMRATATFNDDTTDTGKRGLRFRLVTAAEGTIEVGQLTIPPEGRTTLSTAAPVVLLAAGDTVSVQAWQSSGAPLGLQGAVLSGRWRTTFTMMRVSG